MIRTQILGLGSYVPDRIVGNDELPFLDDQHRRQDTRQIETDDEWIQKRTGIQARRYVPNDGSVATSDLALAASQRALEDAHVSPGEIDCIIFGTLSPDFHFPGLKPGDRWCVCAGTWREAYERGVAPPVILAATHEETLAVVPLAALQEHAVDGPS